MYIKILSNTLNTALPRNIFKGSEPEANQRNILFYSVKILFKHQ